MARRLRIGTRGSKLALIQANEVARRLGAAQGLPQDEAAEIVVISTSGDRIQDRNLSEVGGKGLFTKEIEEALIDGGIDLAVHSMKDMPTVLPAGLVIDCVLERADPRDAFISLKYESLDALPKRARFGTSSLRRAAQIASVRPDLEIVPFRGNVDTRIAKLERAEADATLLAMAGLTRMGLAARATSPVPVEVMLPAVAQGVIGIERRESDKEAGDLLAKLNDLETFQAMTVERAFLGALDGSCRTPIAGHAVLEGDRVRFRGAILRPDGSEVHETAREGALSDGVALGLDAARELRSLAAPDFFTVE